MNISHKPPQKGECNEIFTTKETYVPHLKFCILFYRVYRKGGWFYMYVSMYFKIMSKVVKYTCRIRRYNYTHNQLNTRYYFLGFFLRGGGAKFKFAPGRQLPSLRHCKIHFISDVNAGGWGGVMVHNGPLPHWNAYCLLDIVNLHVHVLLFTNYHQY